MKVKVSRSIELFDFFGRDAEIEAEWEFEVGEHQIDIINTIDCVTDVKIFNSETGDQIVDKRRFATIAQAQKEGWDYFENNIDNIHEEAVDLAALADEAARDQAADHRMDLMREEGRR